MSLSEGIELLIGGNFAPLREALVGAEREVDRWAVAATASSKKAAAASVHLAEEAAKRKVAVLEHETKQAEAELAERQKSAEAAARKLADAERKSAAGVTGIVAEEVRRRAALEAKAAEDLQRRLTDIQKRGADARAVVAQTEARRVAAVQAQEAERSQARAASGRQALLAGGGALASSAVAVGLGMTVREATSTFAAFEGVLNQVRAVSGATEAQMAAMTAQALDLGAKTKFSAKEAAEGLSELAKAGFGAEQAMAALPGVLSLAAAGGVGVGQAAEVAAAAIAGFGLSAQDAGRVADVLAKTANLSAVGISDLQNTFKYIAPVASSASQSLEEMATAVAIMGNSGIKGEQAGTTLRGAISRLIDPPKEAAASLAQLGMHLVDTQGRMLPLSVIVGELREKTARLTETQRNQAVGNIFGQEALSGMLALLRQAPDAYATTAASVRDAAGASEEMASVMNRGLGASLEQLGGAAESLAIVFGKQFAPALQQVAGGLAGMAEWASKLPEGTQALAAGATAAGIAVLGLGGGVAGLATAVSLSLPALEAAGVALGVGLGPVAWGVAAAIGALGLAVGAYVTASAGGQRASEEAALGLEKQRGAITSLLADYDELKGKSRLTADEQAHLNAVIGKLSDLVPGSVRQFDALGRATDLSREAVERHNGALDANIAKLKEQQRQARVSEQQALDALGAEIAQMREGMKTQGALIPGRYNNDAHMASLQAALAEKVADYNARSRALRQAQLQAGALPNFGPWAGGLHAGPGPVQEFPRPPGAGFSDAGRGGSRDERRSGLSPQSLAMLDQALAKATISGATMCYKRVEQVMRLATGKALGTMSGDTRLRGTPISQLPELVRSGAIKPGTAMYWNLRPGTDPRSTNMANLPHWGTVRPDGSIDDNHRRRWTPEQFAQAYKGRLLDATFNPFGPGGATTRSSDQRVRAAQAEAKRKAEAARRQAEDLARERAEMQAHRRSSPQGTTGRMGAGGTLFKEGGMLGGAKTPFDFQDRPKMKAFAGELEDFAAASQDAAARSKAANETIGEGLNVLLGAVTELAASPSWERAGEVLGRVLGNPTTFEKVGRSVEAMGSAFQKVGGGVAGISAAFQVAAGAISPVGLAISGLGIAAPLVFNAIGDAISGPKGLREGMDGWRSDLAAIQSQLELGVLSPLQAITAEADSARSAVAKFAKGFADLGGETGDTADRKRLAEVEAILGDPSALFRSELMGAGRGQLVTERGILSKRIFDRSNLKNAAVLAKDIADARELEARVNGPLQASPLKAIRQNQAKREARLASDKDLLGLGAAEVAQRAYQDLLSTVSELDDALDLIGRGTMDAEDIQRERDWMATKVKASKVEAEAKVDLSKAVDDQVDALADLNDYQKALVTHSGTELTNRIQILKNLDASEGSAKRRLDAENRLAQLTSLQNQQADLQGQIRDASLERLDAEREISDLLRSQADDAERIRGESIAQRQLSEAQNKAKRLADLEQQGQAQLIGLRSRYEQARDREVALLTQLQGVQDGLQGMKGDAGRSGFASSSSGLQAALAAIYATAPRFHSGGVVPGARGAEVPAVLQAGEMVLDLSTVEALLSTARNGGGALGPNTIAAIRDLGIAGARGGAQIANVTLNLTAGLGVDGQEFGRVIVRELESQLRRMGFKT